MGKIIYLSSMQKADEPITEIQRLPKRTKELVKDRLLYLESIPLYNKKDGFPTTEDLHESLDIELEASIAPNTFSFTAYRFALFGVRTQSENGKRLWKNEHGILELK